MILNDTQIIERCQGPEPMIRPFEPDMVRSVNDKKVVSFGTSSFGYDVRCAPHFKIFTNVHSAIVDPKNFNPQSFVSVEDDYCIIPPNSFALAHTIETFIIPRDILVLCVGKSTYARCFSGDTKVALANGSCISLAEMTREYAKGSRFFGYGVSRKLGLVVTEFKNPRLVNTGEKLVRVHLDSGGYVDSTPDHLFLTRKGKYVRADELTTGDSLMPLYRYRHRGREVVYNPNPDIVSGGVLNFTYRLSDQFNLRSGEYEAGSKEHRHHVDEDVANDYPTNIRRMPMGDHVRHHNADYYGENFDPILHSEKIKKSLKKRGESKDWYEKFLADQKRKIREFWDSPIHEKARARRAERVRAGWTDERRASTGQRMRNLWKDPDYRRGRELTGARPRKEFEYSEVRQLMRETGSLRKTARALGTSVGLLTRRYPKLVEHLRCKGVLQRPLPNNHRVIKVTTLKGRHDVYCLESPETGNFALEEGVFVKNCGIIVNVTPLEPEWEGQVTLEFSNTTNLPAKIYAGEGVAQMLFLKGDPCAKSYMDRSGKYQGQTGVTLPRM